MSDATSSRDISTLSMSNKTLFSRRRAQDSWITNKDVIQLAGVLYLEVFWWDGVERAARGIMSDEFGYRDPLFNLYRRDTPELIYLQVDAGIAWVSLPDTARDLFTKSVVRFFATREIPIEVYDYPDDRFYTRYATPALPPNGL